MKKSIIIFVAAVIMAVGATAYGWIFVDGQIGEATITEETIAGDKAAADGLVVGFRADSSDNLSWTNSFDYSAAETESHFNRGEMPQKVKAVVYDDIRFAGWSAAPFFTRLTYDRLEGLQDKGIHIFYDEIQKRVAETGAEETGKIRLKEYTDFYPVSFQFQFGTKVYDSENALKGLKIYENRDMISSEAGTAYDDDVDLYTAFNGMFRIPVIENEYQEYAVSKVEKHDYKKELGYNTEIKKPLEDGEDYYEFDPIIVLQEENIRDNKKWHHPDLTGDVAYEADSEEGESASVKSASEYNLKNRMLLAVNNRTVKGEPIDVSQMGDGFGVYELPFEVVANQTISQSPKSWTGAHPEPVMEELKMVYPLDNEAEYVEMSLSEDHRYLAIFSVKEGEYFVELVDADNWTSSGAFEAFPAEEKMTYAWGEDGSLAMTNHEGYVAVLARAEGQEEPYKVIYSGRTSGNLDTAFFDKEMLIKENSTARYQYGVDRGLAVAAKDGKIALVQNLLIGNSEVSIRSAALECAVIDESGVIYRGRLKSDIVDLDYDMSMNEVKAVRNIIDGAAKDQAKIADWLIEPVRNENRAEWK